MGSATRADVPLQMIATADIGEVAASRLAALDFTGSSALELMGPRDVTMAQVAAAIGKAIGKPDLKYVAFLYDEARTTTPASIETFAEKVFAPAFRAGQGQVTQSGQMAQGRGTRRPRTEAPDAPRRPRSAGSRRPPGAA